MSQKRKRLLVIVVLVAAALLHRAVYVHFPSEAVIVFDDYAGTSFEEPLTKEEVQTFRRILWGKPPLPEALTGSLACGFGKGLSIVMGDTRYMLAWDSCGTLCLKDISSDRETSWYVEISDGQRNAIKQMFDTRIQRARAEEDS